MLRRIGKKRSTLLRRHQTTPSQLFQVSWAFMCSPLPLPTFALIRSGRLPNYPCWLTKIVTKNEVGSQRATLCTALVLIVQDFLRWIYVPRFLLPSKSPKKIPKSLISNVIFFRYKGKHRQTMLCIVFLFYGLGFLLPLTGVPNFQVTFTSLSPSATSLGLPCSLPIVLLTTQWYTSQIASGRWRKPKRTAGLIILIWNRKILYFFDCYDRSEALDNEAFFRLNFFRSKAPKGFEPMVIQLVQIYLSQMKGSDDFSIPQTRATRGEGSLQPLLHSTLLTCHVTI